jgi:hypothetical protein
LSQKNGPHEGRELELMLGGSKPLSMFVEPVPADVESFPEAQFDRFADEGRLIKFVSVELCPLPSGENDRLRRVFDALPNETWRINAFFCWFTVSISHLVQDGMSILSA